MKGHVYDYKRFLKGKFNNITSFEIIKNGNYDIVLVETCLCKSKDELSLRERYWTEQIPCINKQKPGLYIELRKVEYKKQFYDEHKDKIQERHRQYYDKHKDKIKEWHTIKCDCKCGGKYTLRHKAEHMKTKIHRDYIENETLKQCPLDGCSFDETYQKIKNL